jgi:hypothetical protein
MKKKENQVEKKTISSGETSDGVCIDKRLGA